MLYKSKKKLSSHVTDLELLGSLLQVVERLDTQAAVDRDKRHLVELRILAERGNLDLHQILVLLLVVERHNLVVRRTLLGQDLQNLNLLRLQIGIKQGLSNSTRYISDHKGLIWAICLVIIVRERIVMRLLYGRIISIIYLLNLE